MQNDKRHLKLPLFWLVCALLLFLIGCQPTPESPVVINKNDGKLAEIIAATANPDAADAADTIFQAEAWNEEYTLPLFSCHFRAEVLVPEAGVFPVYKIQSAQFTTDQSNELVDYFTQNALGVRESTDTREGLTDQLIAAKKGTYVWDDNGGRWESYDGQQADIKRLEEQILQTEAESFEPLSDAPIALPFDLTYQMPGDKRAYLMSTENYFLFSDIDGGIIQPESWVLWGDAIPDEPKGTSLQNVDISEEDAMQASLELLDALSIQDFGISEIMKARIINSYTSATLTEGWYVYLSRNYEKYDPVDFTDYQPAGMLYFPTEEYAPRWEMESIKLFVDAQGIRYFCWKSRTEITEEMNPNVSILGFEAAKTHIKNYIQYGSMWMHTVEIVPPDITVYEIKLTGVMLPIKDDPAHMLIVPAWLAYYNIEGRGEQFSPYIFAVNAIDGSSIHLVSLSE